MNNRKESKVINTACYAALLLFALTYITYCSLTYVELPYSTWFDQMPLADLYYTGKMRVHDLFSRYYEHGMLANNIIYLINIILFHGITLFDIYLNSLNVIIAGWVLAYSTMKIMDSRKDIIFWLIAEFIFMFSLFQGSAGGMDTQVRMGLLFFILTMVMVDRELCQDNCSRLHFFSTICMIVLSINVFGTLYSFAGVPCVWIIVLYKRVAIGKVKRRHIIISLVYLLTIPVYLIEYGGLGGTPGNLGVGRSLSNFYPIEIIKGLAAWYANGVLGWSFHESHVYREAMFLAVGAMVFVITVVSVVLFVRLEMYKKTWLPLMFIVYPFGVFALVYLGRATGWDWFSNEWYTVHLKISAAAVIWIYAYSYDRIKRFKAGIVGVCILVVAFGIIGNYYTVKRAPAIHNYLVEKQKYLYIDNPSDMPVDETGSTPLLHSLDVTMNSIEIMRKYNLSVYQYWDAYKACSTIRLSDNVVKYISGRYDDGWCEQEMTFLIHTGDISKLEVSYMTQSQQNITITINDRYEKTIQLYEGEGVFDIPCSSNIDMRVILKSDYAAKLTDPDQRVASYLLSDIVCVE